MHWPVAQYQTPDLSNVFMGVAGGESQIIVYQNQASRPRDSSKKKKKACNWIAIKSRGPWQWDRLSQATRCPDSKEGVDQSVARRLSGNTDS